MIAPQQNPLPMLAVVVVTRNEERRIARSLDSVFNAVKPYSDTTVIVVDSDSTDDTTRIAQRYPAIVCRYSGAVRSAAAGRRIGFGRVDARYVLFLDGDCTLLAGWLPTALRLLEAQPDAAVVYGGREDVFEERGPGQASAGPDTKEHGLGGNALYRSEVLRAVGGFNPFILGDEEGELLGRVKAAGYRAVASPVPMIQHHTAPQQSLWELVRRRRRGLTRGAGQVLRASLAQGLFGYYLRYFNRILLTLAFLAAGVTAAVIGLMYGTAAPVLIWLALGFVAYSLLAVRRASLSEATYLVALWTIVAIDLIPGFLGRQRSPDSFDPAVEILSTGMAQQCAQELHWERTGT